MEISGAPSQKDINQPLARETKAHVSAENQLNEYKPAAGKKGTLGFRKTGGS